MADKANLKETLIAAAKNGDFLDAVYNIHQVELDEREDLPREIVALHKDGHINAVAEFAKLDNTQGSGPDFFMMRLILEKTLPHINAPMRDAMRCVLHLYKGAGQDVLAGRIFDSYIAYCEKDPARPLEAMKIIEGEHDQFADALPSTIVAGSRIDNQYYLSEALRLSRHPVKVLRRRAVLSLANIEWPKEAKVPKEALSGLEESATEDDDQILASVIKSAFALYQQDKTTEARVTALIDNALSRGDECALHAGAEIFVETEEIPAPLLDVLLGHLKHVKPTNKGTLHNIDGGITTLLKEVAAEKALRFLEELLLLNTDTLTIENFNGAADKILTNKTLLSRVTTRWFLNGAPALCESVHNIIGMSHEDTLTIDIDASELTTKDCQHITFVARKAIGYLFMKPVTAASILISLMRPAPDDETLEYLGKLLLDSLLINYPGSVREYVKDQARQETGKVKKTLDKALAELTAYLDPLRAVPTLAALHPSQAHREAYNRYKGDTGELFEASMKEAEKHSELLRFALQSTLLYGRKAINYVHGDGGPPRRMEIPMKSYSRQMELPRMEYLDEHGLNYMLRFFRAQRRRT